MRKFIIAGIFGLLAMLVAFPATAQTSLPDNSVSSPEVVNQSLQSWDLAPDSVGASELKAGAAGKSEVRADAVGFSELIPAVEAAICPSGSAMIEARVLVFDGPTGAFADDDPTNDVTEFSNATTLEREAMASVVNTLICG